MRCVAIAAIVSLSGCATYHVVGLPAPVRSASVRSVPDEVFGAQVTLYSGDTEYHAELLGCDDEFVYIEVNAENQFLRVPWIDIREMRAHRFNYGPVMLGWGLTGTVSTLSHGAFLFISAPVWMIVGGIATGVSWSVGPRLSGCDAAKPYARFPQGVPIAYVVRHHLAEVAPSPTPSAVGSETTLPTIDVNIPPPSSSSPPP